MRDSIYVIFNKNGIKPNGTRKSMPPLQAGEYAVRLDLTVDEKYFDRIIPVAKVEVDEKFIIDGPKVEVNPIESKEEAPKDEKKEKEKPAERPAVEENKGADRT